MKVGVPRETVPGEQRVAIVPEAAAKLVAAKHEVIVESGAGPAVATTTRRIARPARRSVTATRRSARTSW